MGTDACRHWTERVGGIMASWLMKPVARGGAVVVLVGLTVWSEGTRAQQAKTAADGVFSAAQAARGEAIYKSQCATCHGAALEGAAAPPLAGNAFNQTWS